MQHRHQRHEQAIDVIVDGPALILAGRFDARSTWRVRAELYDLLAVYDEVVVDLTDVVAVDVTALKVLAAASFAAGRDGHRVTLRGCNGAVRRLLHMSHLIRLVEVDRTAVGA